MLSKRLCSGFAITAVLGVLAVTWALQSPPSRDFRDYVLIGFTSVRLGPHAEVTSGNVGVNAFTAPGARGNGPGTFSLSRSGQFAPGAAVVADTVRLADFTMVGRVFANVFLPARGAQSGAPQRFDAAPGGRLFEHPPTIPGFDCSSGSAEGAIVLGRGQRSDGVRPGIFRELVLHDDATITLAGGVYRFDNIRLGRRAVLSAQHPATINVCQAARFSNKVRIVSGTDTATGLVLNVAGSQVTFGNQSTVTAIVHAPRARMRLGAHNTLRGRFIGDVVTSNTDVQLTCDSGGAAGCTATTVPATTTTTTTIRPSSPVTTTTLPVGNAGVAEVCGNCVDDDGDGLSDFEDPDCCQQTQAFTMSVRRGRIRGNGSTSALRLTSVLAAAGVPDVYHDDVVLQLRPAGGKDVFCARVPAGSFRRVHGDPTFRDRTHAVAQGIDRVAVHLGKNGRARLRVLGRDVRFAAPAGGALELTVGFRDPTLPRTDQTTNRCARATQAFRTRRGALLTP